MKRNLQGTFELTNIKPTPDKSTGKKRTPGLRLTLKNRGGATDQVAHFCGSVRSELLSVQLDPVNVHAEPWQGYGVLTSYSGSISQGSSATHSQTLNVLVESEDPEPLAALFSLWNHLQSGQLENEGGAEDEDGEQLNVVELALERFEEKPKGPRSTKPASEAGAGDGD